MLLNPSFTEATGVWYEANVILEGQNWIIADLRIKATGGCVPEEMTAAALAAYEAYSGARTEFWDPPDPDHPLIDQVLVDPQRSFIVGLLEEHAAQGVALWGQPTTHAEVIEVRSPTELVILSCLEPDPDYGLYDLDTNQRLPVEIPQNSPVPPDSNPPRHNTSAPWAPIAGNSIAVARASANNRFIDSSFRRTGSPLAPIRASAARPQTKVQSTPIFIGGPPRLLYGDKTATS